MAWTALLAVGCDVRAEPARFDKGRYRILGQVLRRLSFGQEAEDGHVARRSL